MAKSRDRDIFPSPDQSRPQKALLFELKGRRDAEDGIAATVSTEMIAALSIEEVVAYVRGRQPSVEIRGIEDAWQSAGCCPVQNI